ncbi:hypothetical protein [Pseudomonas sp. 58 R 3]|nr:hypothetical protein [Pseudomonas sp. 58 R 3]
MDFKKWLAINPSERRWRIATFADPIRKLSNQLTHMIGACVRKADSKQLPWIQNALWLNYKQRLRKSRAFAGQWLIYDCQTKLSVQARFCC